MPAVVSVVIPTYDRRDLLGRAIDSALSQTHAGMEVIVVDDGSSDGTWGMLRGRYGRDARVKAIRQDNQGVCVARNVAMDAAQGDFIAFLDSDDVWRPWKIEAQLACLAHWPDVGMVWTDMESLGRSGDVTHARFLRRMYGTYRHFDESALFETTEMLGSMLPHGCRHLANVPARRGRIGTAMMVGNLVHTSTVLMTRARLAQAGRFDESLAPAGEDHDFHLRVCQAGPVALIDVPAISYQTGRDDRLTRHREIMARNYLRTMERAVARASAEDRPPGHVLRKARARGHAWLGGVLLDQGDCVTARRHLLHSLRLDPLQPRRVAEVIAASVPKPLLSATRHVVAGWRRRRRAGDQPVCTGSGAPAISRP